jgi:hypothetical protein
MTLFSGVTLGIIWQNFCGEQNALWFLARDSDFVMTLAFSCLGVKREASAEPQSKS